MESSIATRSRIADLFRRQLWLSLRLEGATWTLAALRTPVRERFEKAGYTAAELAQASVDQVAARMMRTPSEVLAYAQIAGLEISATERGAVSASSRTELAHAQDSPRSPQGRGSVIPPTPAEYSVCLEDSDGGSNDSDNAEDLPDIS